MYSEFCNNLWARVSNTEDGSLRWGECICVCHIHALERKNRVSVLPSLSFWWEFRTCHLKIGCFGMLNILSYRHLERLSLNSLSLSLNTDPPKGTKLPQIPPGVSPTEKWFITGEETRSQNHTQTLSQTIIALICSSKGLFIFPPNHSPSP